MSLWHALRTCFPVTEAGVHLDHARLAPLPSRVDETVRAFTDAASHRAGHAERMRVAREIERVRGRVGLLLDASPDEVAFVSGARSAIEAVIRDLSWRRGDVVVHAGEGVPLPEPALARHGVECLRVPLLQGAFSLDAIEGALRHPRARLLALASVQAHNGARAPLAPLAELCAERGVLLCVDASHHAGALPLRLRGDGIDYLLADAHHFLLGPPGAGLLLRNGRSAPGEASAARRFERDAPNALGVVGLGAAVDLLLELGLAGVEKRVLELTDLLVDGLAARGIDPWVPRAVARSPIVAFRAGREPAQETVDRLDARRIWVSAAARNVRVSPHAYAVPEDVEALLDAL